MARLLELDFFYAFIDKTRPMTANTSSREPTAGKPNRRILDLVFEDL